MKRTLFTITIFLSFLLMNAQNNPGQPDFAFPKKVSSTALTEYDNAINNKDYDNIVSSLVAYELATAAIDRDSLEKPLILISETIGKVDAPTAAILNILLADIYYDIYASARYKYDSREIPETEPGGNFLLWSGQQFKSRISSLIDSALVNPHALRLVPITGYSKSIISDKNNRQFYPTVYDFVANKAIRILGNLAPTIHDLSLNLLCRYDVYSRLSFNYQSPDAQKILNLYSDLLKFNEGKTGPFIISDINRINFISESVFNDGDDNGAPSRRTELLYDLYDKFKSSKYSGEALIQINIPDTNDSASTKRYFNALSGFVRTYPGYFRINCIKNALATITRPIVNISFPQVTVPGKEVKIDITSINATDYTLNIYKVPYSSYSADISRYKPTKQIPCKVKGKAPFLHHSVETITLDSPGTYAISATVMGNSGASRHCDVIQCTNLAAGTSAYSGNRWGYVVNPLTGKPMTENVTLNIIGDRNAVIAKIPVNPDGFTPIDSKGNTLYATSGNDRSDNTYIVRSYPASAKTVYSINAFTDLAIYHPGDTVQWCVVLQSCSPKENAVVVPDTELEVTLRNASYELIDTIRCTTDTFGRATGKFPIPKGDMTGYYSMQFRHIGSNGHPSTYGSKSFMVSDYKLPTYEVKITGIQRDYPAKGDITVSGKAESYSGFPMGGCNVNVNLEGMRYNWWRSAVQKSFYTTTTTTGTDGNFSVTFQSDLLNTSPIAGGMFQSTFDVTSPTGENQSVQTRFSTGKPYILRASVPQNINATKPTDFALELINPMSEPVNEPVEYLFIQGNDTVASGIIDRPGDKITLDKIASGTYSISFRTKDAALATPYTAENINIYRPDDACPPITGEPIWLPETKLLTSSRDMSILYGTTADTCYVHYAISDGDTLLKQGYSAVTPGMHRFEYTLPENVSSANIAMWAVNNYKTSDHNIEVTLKSALKGINLTIESFRDKIVPGDKETWRFTVTDCDGKPSRSAIILDMYCKALDAIRPYSMHFSRLTPAANFYRLQVPHPDNSMSSSFYGRTGRQLNCPSLTLPYINTWNQPYYLEQIFNTVYTRKMYASANVMAVDEAKPAGRAMGTDDIEETAVESYMAAIPDATSDGGTDNSKDEGTFQYRPAEIPLAFFEPTLTTSDDGSLSYSFTAPDANTTWRLCALAFDRSALSAGLSREIISSKPVMVKPNMPRFLRNGDRAVISALVMNNSVSRQAVSTTVEVFDPITGTISDIFTHTDTIDSGMSATVNTPVNAPMDAAMLGYRVRSSIEGYSDGEQSIIPVLPSVSPVIETLPFYIPADEQSFGLKLPDIRKDASVILQFCNNPIWYVVTALPGLRKDDAADALSQSASIFSAAIAQGIMAKDPSIATAIKQWRDNPSDSTLTSMLQRNEDLKIILLNATPWSMDAKNQTERMARLALLFDNSTIEAAYNKAIKQLSNLECYGGGWSWTANYGYPSQWITENILANLGRLRQLGFGPKDPTLDNMASRAIGYLDREVAKMLKQSPDASDMSYLVVRDYYPEIPIPSSTGRIVANTLKSIRTGWKNYDAPTKAIAAMLLWRHNEKSLARDLMESLKEYSVSSKEKGMWWPSLDNMTAWSMGKISATALILDAFATISPSSHDVDDIRQWLILQKEAKDWGTSVSTSDAIYSILSCGSSWTRTAAVPQISIGRKKLDFGEIDSRLGYLRTDISELHPSKKELSIAGHDSIPSWGAVFIRFRSEISEIKAAGCDDVTIEKQLFRKVNTPDGEKWMQCDTLAVGDIVQVNLTIETKRDMDYVTIIDERGACLEPVEQLPSPIFSEGICFYRENRDAVTNIFVDHLPKGVYRLSYELNVNNAGQFSTGVATIQSQYAPALTAHSSGAILTVIR